MIDAENLCKLIRKIPPDTGRDFLTRHFEIELPELDSKQNLTQQRRQLCDALEALSIKARQHIEQAAEGIMLLSDAAGQDALASLCTKHLTDESKSTISAITSPCLRSLWFYENAHRLFVDALNARQADIYRQSQTCYSGFVAPPNLEIHKDPDALAEFHRNIAKHLECAEKDVAIQLFCRLRTDAKSHDDTVLYQISIHYNLSPESIDCVQESELIAHDIIRAAATHVTYEPESGHLDVLSKERSEREALAGIVADTLLGAPFDGSKIPLKQYSYQCLAAPFVFDIADEPIHSVKVTELGFEGSDGGTSLTKLRQRDKDSIHAIAKSLYASEFRFTDHHINYAKINIKLKKEGRGRQRTISIILRGDNQCNIKTKREQDRALCDHLLIKWHLVREIGDDNQSIAA